MTSTFDPILLWTEGQNELRPAKIATNKGGKRGRKKRKGGGGEREEKEVLQPAQNKKMQER